MKQIDEQARASLFRAWKPVAVLICALVALPATVASSATNLNDPGWAGPAGAPSGTVDKKHPNPVIDVTMRFKVPTLNCNRAIHTEKVAVWVGMDNLSLAGNPLTQVGLIGECTLGDPRGWHGFFETIPNRSGNGGAQAIPSLGNVDSGSIITIRLDYVPNISPDLFLATFKVWSGTTLVKSTTQYIQSPNWGSRSRGECITERLGVNLPIQHWPVANFSDFTASCVVGARSKKDGSRLSDFIPNSSSDMYTAKENGKTYITAKKQGDLSVKFHWLRS
jgi:hypothetical protein